MVKTTINHEEGTNFEIRPLAKKKYPNLPYRTSIVKENKIMDKDLKVTISTYTLFQKMSHSAHWLFWTLAENVNVLNNITVFRAKNNVEAKKVTVGYKELFDLNLVRRIKRQHYLINPNAVIPHFDYYEEVVKGWRKLELTEMNKDGITLTSLDPQEICSTEAGGA